MTDHVHPDAPARSTLETLALLDEHLRSPRLTLKAKGLLAIFATGAADTTTGAREISRSGRDTTAAALRELLSAGAIFPIEIRDELGRIAGVRYEVRS